MLRALRWLTFRDVTEHRRVLDEQKGRWPKTRLETDFRPGGGKLADGPCHTHQDSLT